MVRAGLVALLICVVALVADIVSVGLPYWIRVVDDDVSGYVVKHSSSSPINLQTMKVDWMRKDTDMSIYSGLWETCVQVASETSCEETHFRDHSWFAIVRGMEVTAALMGLFAVIRGIMTVTCVKSNRSTRIMLGIFSLGAGLFAATGFIIYVVECDSVDFLHAGFALNVVASAGYLLAAVVFMVCQRNDKLVTRL